jgi:hypothetical protein
MRARKGTKVGFQNRLRKDHKRMTAGLENNFGVRTTDVMLKHSAHNPRPAQGVV